MFAAKKYTLSAFMAFAISANPLLGAEIKGECLFSIGGFPITNSIITTWIFAIIIIALFRILIGRRAQEVPSKGQMVVESMIDSLRSILEPLMGTSAFKGAFPLLLGFFAYILIMDWSGLLPGVGSIGEFESVAPISKSINPSNANLSAQEIAVSGATTQAEPLVAAPSAQEENEKFVPYLRPANTDLNTTLALAIISFGAWIFFVLKYAGAKAFLHDTFGNKATKQDVGSAIYFSLFIVFFAVGCIDIVSILMRLLSLSFRLYGNNFGGEVLLENMHQMAISLPRWISWLIPIPFYLLEMLIGLIQAFLFTLLTAVYIGLLTMHSDEEPAK